MDRPVYTLTQDEFDTIFDGVGEIIKLARSLLDEPERIFEVGPEGAREKVLRSPLSSRVAHSLISVLTNLNSVTGAVTDRYTAEAARHSGEVRATTERIREGMAPIETPEVAEKVVSSMLLGAVVGGVVEIDRGNIPNAHRVLVQVRKAVAPLLPAAFGVPTRAQFAKDMTTVLDQFPDGTPPEFLRIYEGLIDEAFPNGSDCPSPDPAPVGPRPPQITLEEIDRLWADRDAPIPSG